MIFCKVPKPKTLGFNIFLVAEWQTAEPVHSSFFFFRPNEVLAPPKSCIRWEKSCFSRDCWDLISCWILSSTFVGPYLSIFLKPVKELFFAENLTLSISDFNFLRGLDCLRFKSSESCSLFMNVLVILTGDCFVLICMLYLANISCDIESLLTYSIINYNLTSRKCALKLKFK